MNQERVRSVIGLRHCGRHAVASLVPVVDRGGDALPGHRPPPRFRPAPASRRLDPCRLATGAGTCWGAGSELNPGPAQSGVQLLERPAVGDVKRMRYTMAIDGVPGIVPASEAELQPLAISLAATCYVSLHLPYA